MEISGHRLEANPGTVNHLIAGFSESESAIGIHCIKRRIHRNGRGPRSIGNKTGAPRSSAVVRYRFAVDLNAQRDGRCAREA